MANYILRDLPPDIWTRAKERAERDGWPLRALFLRLLDDFGAGRMTPSGTPPTLNRYGHAANKVFPPAVTQDPPPPPSLSARLGLRPPRSPARAVVIKFRNQAGDLRLSDAASAREDGADLVIFDAEHHQVGRIALAGVESWFVEG